MLRAFDHILGLNARNDRIARRNPHRSIRLVDDKHATKQALADVGAPAAPTIALVRSWRQARRLDLDALPESWALKPNQSLGGSGILLAAGRRDGAWHSASGRPIPARALAEHLRFILDGEFSPRDRDWALFEPLLRAHPRLRRLSYQGLPDVRVICHDDRPKLAMLRLPTAASGGRANLHQRAIGAAVDLACGRVIRAWSGREPVTSHPDSGEPLIGAVVPHWDGVIEAASRCAAATGLRYLGADVVVDERLGPVILEVNARPGLQIQNVTGHGLAETVEMEVAR
jgi:alpha-L-glutamate ligase-like protein